MKTLEMWIKENKNQIFQVLTYKKVWTPYEQDKKYSDESMFEEGNYPLFCYITDATEVPEGTLLELTEVMQNDENIWEETNIKHYKLLNNIQITKIEME